MVMNRTRNICQMFNPHETRDFLHLIRVIGNWWIHLFAIGFEVFGASKCINRSWPFPVFQFGIEVCVLGMVFVVFTIGIRTMSPLSLSDGFKTAFYRFYWNG